MLVYRVEGLQNLWRHVCTAQTLIFYALSESLDKDMKNRLEDTIRKTTVLLMRWWPVMLMFVAISIAATIWYTNRLTPVYSARATLEVDLPDDRLRSTEAAVNLDPNEFLSTQLFKLRSRGLLEQILDAEKWEQSPVMENFAPGQRREGIITKLEESLDIDYLGDSRVLGVRFTHTDPNLVALIPNNIVRAFESNNDQIGAVIDQTERQELATQLLAVKSQMESAEEALVKYANREDLQTLSTNFMTNDLSNTAEYANLETLRKNVRRNRSIVVEKKAAYDRLSQGLESAIVQQEPEIVKLQSAVNAFEKEYSENLLIYKSDYPDMVALRQKIEYTKDEIESVYFSLLTTAEVELEQANTESQRLERQIQRATLKLNDIREAVVRYNRLKLDVQSSRAEYEGLLERLQAQAASGVYPNASITVLDLAQIPEKPIYPKLQSNLIKAISGASLFSVFFVLVMSIIDNRISSPDDAIEKLGLPLLGVIPKLKNKNIIEDLISEPLSVASESYATTRAKIQNMLTALPATPCIQVTSTRAGEGKSVSSLALAKSFAVTDTKVLLIDADLRLPTFGTPNSGSIGLAGILATDGLAIPQILKTLIDNLYFLEAGKEPHDPARLLASPRLKAVLEEVKEEFDVIIVDGPPVLGLSDALSIGKVCTHTILVTQSHALPARAVQNTRDILRPACQNLLGVVMTKYKYRHGQQTYHYSRYTYGKKATQYGKSRRGIFGKAARSKTKIDIT